MKSLNRLAIIVALTLAGFTSNAQEAEMADTFRADGKIYVVVAIILIILIGFIGYLISLDRKITKLEKLVQNKDPKTK